MTTSPGVLRVDRLVGAADAAGCHRERCCSFKGDIATAHAAGDPAFGIQLAAVIGQRVEVEVRLLQQSQRLGPLVGDRCALRVVLVVGRDQFGCLDD